MFDGTACPGLQATSRACSFHCIEISPISFCLPPFSSPILFLLLNYPLLVQLGTKLRAAFLLRRHVTSDYYGRNSREFEKKSRASTRKSQQAYGGDPADAHEGTTRTECRRKLQQQQDLNEMNRQLDEMAESCKRRMQSVKRRLKRMRWARRRLNTRYVILEYLVFCGAANLPLRIRVYRWMLIDTTALRWLHSSTFTRYFTRTGRQARGLTSSAYYFARFGTNLTPQQRPRLKCQYGKAYRHHDQNTVPYSTQHQNLRIICLYHSIQVPRLQ